MTIGEYNQSLTGADLEIAKLLFKEINLSLPEATSKLWHGGPVWFLNDNPVVGYDKLKDCIRLLFWSGQSFNEPGLQNEGSFKAAEARYTDVNQINVSDLRAWLQKSKVTQWDYKNIVKHRGVLEKIS